MYLFWIFKVDLKICFSKAPLRWFLSSWKVFIYPCPPSQSNQPLNCPLRMSSNTESWEPVLQYQPRDLLWTFCTWFSGLTTFIYCLKTLPHPLYDNRTLKENDAVVFILPSLALGQESFMMFYYMLTATLRPSISFLLTGSLRWLN